MQRLEVSSAVRPKYGSLGVKWLSNRFQHKFTELTLICYYKTFLV